MKYYFKLQFTILCRKLTVLGIPPVIAFIIGGIAFYYGSNTLFNTREHANYIYTAVALSLLFRLNDQHKSNFVKAHYSKNKHLQIQFFEKSIVVLPFIIFLIYKKEFLCVALLFAFTILATFFSFRNNNTLYIPTPFSKKPFEFCVGFRKTFFLLPLCYAIAVISGQVGNVNLGIFALVALFMITTIYYAKREPDMYIWMHKFTPKKFLSYKVKQGIFNLLALQAPAFVILILAFPEHFFLLVFIILINMVALCVRIFIKYALKNNAEMNLVEGFIYWISVFIFPFLIILFPMYYKQAINKLSNIL